MLSIQLWDWTRKLQEASRGNGDTVVEGGCQEGDVRSRPLNVIYWGNQSLVYGTGWKCSHRWVSLGYYVQNHSSCRLLRRTPILSRRPQVQQHCTTTRWRRTLLYWLRRRPNRRDVSWRTQEQHIAQRPGCKRRVIYIGKNGMGAMGGRQSLGRRWWCSAWSSKERDGSRDC